MNGENRKGRIKARQNNPLPPARQREAGEDMACRGYAVLDRAPLSRFSRERQGIGSEVRDNDGPMDDYGHYGYLP